MSERIPLAVLECTIGSVDKIPDSPEYLSTTGVHVIGCLTFGLKYCKSEGFFSLRLECNPKSRIGRNSYSTSTVDMDWGRYDVEADLQFLKLLEDGSGPIVGSLRARYSKDESNRGYRVHVGTLFNPINNFIRNGEIKVAAKIWSVLPSNLSSEGLKILRAPIPPPTLWESYFELGLGADVSFISADGAQVKAHSGILMTASRVFHAMFDASMTESATREIVLNDMTTGHSVKIFMKCIYTGSLSHLYGVGLTLLIEIINAAEKYNLDELKKGAAAFLPAYACPLHAQDLTHCAQLYGLQEVEKAVQNCIKGINFDDRNRRRQS